MQSGKGWLLAGVLAVALGGVTRADEQALRLGVGAHYWTTVKNIDVHNIDKNGFSYLASVQYWPSWVGLEADVEWFQKGFGTYQDDVYQPQAYLILGKTLYGAAGIGGYYSNGKLGDKPFYAFRVGVDLEVLPHLHLDVNANYRFENWDKLNGSDINSDTITLGAAARLAF